MKIPKKLGSYNLVRQLGAGSMGVVFLARHDFLARPVALKVLPTDLESRQPEFARRFLAEARAAARVLHPNLPTVYEVGTDQGCRFMAMEYIVGEPMSPDLGKSRSIPDLLTLFLQAARGIAAAHAAGIVHRDIKPENVMVTRGGSAKVLDFGIARMEEQVGLTREGTILGSPPYMSPEQARAEKVDARTDIFSFAAMIYEVLAGRRPFPGGDMRTVILARQKLSQPPTPMRKARPELPAALDFIVTRCMAPRTEDRYETMMDVIRDLETVLVTIDIHCVPYLSLAAALESSRQLRIGPPWPEMRKAVLGGLAIAGVGSLLLYPVPLLGMMGLGAAALFLAIRRILRWMDDGAPREATR